MSEAYNGMVACTCSSLDRKHQRSLSNISKTVKSCKHWTITSICLRFVFCHNPFFNKKSFVIFFFKVYESWIKSILIWVVFYMITGGAVRKPPKVETKSKKPPTPPSSAGKKKTPPKSDPYFAMETEDLPV